MADRIASFLFDNALWLMPAIALLCLAAIVFVVRRWPRTVWQRIAAAVPLILLVGLTVIAGTLLYAERNIRTIIEHRVQRLTLHPMDNGNLARVADLRGRIVVLNFWATWCPPCRAEMPDLNQLAERYRSANVAVLTITDETPDRIALFERKVTALKTIVATFESDPPHGKLQMSAYQGRPTTVVLDNAGRVQDIFIGRQPYGRLQRAIERQLRRRA